MKVTKAEKIADRLPHFYMHWDSTTAISSLVSSAGKNLDEAEKDFVAIMRSHWVDSASREDLDRIGGLFLISRKASEPDEDFRGRLKTAVLSYKGGGTLNAVKMMVRITLGLPADYPVNVRENPAVTLKKTWKPRANTEWLVNPRNVKDAEPTITIAIETEHARITDPTITNVDTGQSVKYQGNLSKGDVLAIAGDRATLNGRDVSGKLSGKAPVLPRRKTKWQYTESVGANIGIFDKTVFDQSVFAVDITSAVTLEWEANQPATFDVVLEKGLLARSGVTEAYLQEMLEVVKGCGVKSRILLVDEAGGQAVNVNEPQVGI